MVIIELLVKTEQNTLFLFLKFVLPLSVNKVFLSSLTLAPGRKSLVFVQDQLKRPSQDRKSLGWAAGAGLFVAGPTTFS